MKNRSTDRPITLGVILPDDGPFDYEWLRIEPLLVQHGLYDVRCIVERSPADGVMLVDHLLDIGCEEKLAPCARRLAAQGADVVAWACTSGSFVGGVEWARAQLAALEVAASRPATSTSIALAALPRAQGFTAVDLVSAYTPEITHILNGLLEAEGLRVQEVVSLGCVDTAHSVAVDIEAEIARFAQAVSGRRPIVVPDTAINTLSLLERLQEKADRPVITANQATLWHALAKVGRSQAAANLARPW
jgi:maleate cis-trans isomerase